MAEDLIGSEAVHTKYHRRRDVEEFISNEFLSKTGEYPEHEHFKYATIHVYAVDNINSNGYDRFGKIKYIRDDLMYTITGVDFVIIINEEIWESMQEYRRKALIEHFLYEIKAQYQWEDPETHKIVKGEYEDIPNIPGINVKFQITSSGRFKWKTRKPVGEFPEVIRRYGGWNVDIKDVENSFAAKENNQS
jgi:hypothetical protein